MTTLFSSKLSTSKPSIFGALVFNSFFKTLMLLGAFTGTLVGGTDYGDYNRFGSASATTVTTLKIGTTATDGEVSTTTNATATADDILTTDDEDGVSVTTLMQGASATISVVVSNSTGATCYLNGWIDFDNNGLLNEAERVIKTASITTGTNASTKTFAITVPATAVLGSVGARFRLSTSNSTTNSTGISGSGEVEDYVFNISNICGVGNLVWTDANDNGRFEAGEGASGVLVQLFNTSNVLVGSATTDGSGLYQILAAPGTYYLKIPASEFASGKTLAGKNSILGAGADNGRDDDLDENGIDDAAPATNGIRSSNFTLAAGTEPTTGETGADGGWDTGTLGRPLDAGADLTLDFGFSGCAQVNLMANGSLEIANPANLTFPTAFPLGGSAIAFTRYSTAANTDVAGWTFDQGAYINDPTHSADGNRCIYLDAEGCAGQTFAVGTPITGKTLLIPGQAYTLTWDWCPFDRNSPASPSTTPNTTMYVDLYFVDENWSLNFENGLTLHDTFDPRTGVYNPSPAALSPWSNLGWRRSRVQFIMPSAPASKNMLALYMTTGGATPKALIDNVSLTTSCNPQICSVGNMVFNDTNGNGRKDPAEAGIDDVLVMLYRRPASGPDVLAAQAYTGKGGQYLLSGLLPGDYYMNIDSMNFQPTVPGWWQSGITVGPLYGKTSSFGYADPNATASTATDDNISEKGLDDPTPAANGISSAVFTLGLGTEPVSSAGGTETGAFNSQDDVADANGDMTIDFGFTGMDFGDLADTTTLTGTGDYQTLLANNGPRHKLVPGVRLGPAVDWEGNGLQSTNADGDGTDDDGFAPSSVSFSAGTTASATIQLANTSTAAFLYAFIDLNRDGDFADAGEALATLPVPANATSAVLPVPIPLTAALGSTGFRLRLTHDVLATTAGAAALGLANDGEVEDYMVNILAPSIGLAGLVYEDKNFNGLYDAGSDSLLNGATITLYKDLTGNGITADDTIFTQAGLTNPVTPAGSSYSFTALPAGSYFVKMKPAATGGTWYAGGNPIAANPPPAAKLNNQNYANLNALDTASFFSPVVALSAGTQPAPSIDGDDANTDSTIDFGIWQRMSIGNLVWNDADNDGLAASESGIASVALQLFKSTDALVNNGDDLSQGSTTTSAGGAYSFTGLLPGNYYVKATPTAAFPLKSSGAGSDNGLDNDNNGVTQNNQGQPVYTHLIVLTANSEPGTTAGGGNAENTMDIGLRACPAIAIVPGMPSPLALVQDATMATLTLTASGGTAPYTWSRSGTLPNGLTFNPAVTSTTATFTGTPTVIQSAIQNITATDATGCTTTIAYGIAVGCPAITIIPSTLGPFTVGTTISNVVFTATGGRPSYLWAAATGVPPGLTFTTATATLAGTPTSPGTYTLGLSLTDAGGCPASKSYTVVVGADFGDAPSPYLDAWAGQSASTPKFGALVDYEPARLADDGADEDGVYVVTQAILGKELYVNYDANTSAAAVVNIWVDWNRDGDFADAGEQVLTNVSHSVRTTGTLKIPVPLTATPGPTWLRARISSATGVAATGATVDGEVEDHPVTITDSIKLSGLVFEDANNNGQRDAGERLLPGVQVGALDVPANSAIRVSTFTDATGAWQLSVPPGTWRIVFWDPTFGAFTFATANTGSDLTDSDAVFNSFAGTGDVADMAIASGAADIPSIDCGLVPLANTITHTSRTALGSGNWTGNFTLPKFYDSTASLASLKTTVTLLASQDMYLENKAASSTYMALSSSGIRASVVFPDATMQSPFIGDSYPGLTMAANDGVYAFNPSAGLTYAAMITRPVNRGSMGSAPITSFTGYQGTAAGQTMTLPLTITDTNNWSGGTVFDASLTTFSQAGAAVTYFYEYRDYGDHIFGTAATSSASQLSSPHIRIGTNATDAEGLDPSDAVADKDNLGGNNDEDLTMPGFTVGQTTNLSIPVTIPMLSNLSGSTSRIRVFVDWNGDGDVLDANETLPAQTVATAGTSNIVFPLTPPPGSTGGIRYLRIRISEGATDPTFSGNAPLKGEVEDYAVNVTSVLDFGDLADTTSSTGTADYQTLPANNGPSHFVIAGLSLGANVDSETNAIPTALADGDDTAGSPDDEDGITTFPTFYPGASVTIPVSVLNTTGSVARIFTFIDWNNDGDFADSSETLAAVTVSASAIQQTVNISAVVPAGAYLGRIGARFRLSLDTALGSGGASNSGEVEDYMINVQAALSIGNLVWNDTNGNGVLNAGELGIGNVQVDLYATSDLVAGNGDDVFVATTTTNSAGIYTFSNLTPGKYVVKATPPAAYPLTSGPVVTADNQVDNDNNGSQPGLQGTPLFSPVITLSVGGESIVDGDTNSSSELTVDFALKPCPTLAIAPAVLPFGNVASAYSQTLTATGGSGVYSWAMIGGGTPPGTSLDPSGTLSGMPTTAGTYIFSVRATDTANCSGSLAITVTIRALPVIHAIAKDDSGRYLVGGEFFEINGSSHTNIVRLNRDGSVDETFVTGAPNGPVYAIAFRAGAVYAGGAFTTWGGSTQNLLVKLSAAGIRDTMFAGNVFSGTAGDSVRAISENGFYVAGKFSAPHNGIAAVDPSTGADFTAFAPSGPSPSSTLMDVVYDGTRVVTVGEFTTFNSSTLRGIAAMGAAGTLDAAWTASPVTNNTARSLIQIPGGADLLMGGDFTTYRGVSGLQGTARMSALTGAPTIPYPGVSGLSVNKIYKLKNP